MNKTYLVAILAVVIVLLGLFLLGNNLQNTASLGDANIKVPEGFKVVNSTKDSLKIGNAKTNFTIEETNESISSITDKYNKKHENKTGIDNDLTVGNITVKHLTLVNDDKVVHSNYYYNANNKTYHIFPKGKWDEKSFAT
ncbi:hypothetical protein, partial [Methanosphaera sp.]|uniref:hypothetical protein n=1 Tax=Methanosphaera sp. TaxID=2666342 RepID=UPI002E76FF79